MAVRIENCGGKFRTAAPDQVRILDADGAEWVRAYFDVANAKAFDADPAEGIRLRWAQAGGGGRQGYGRQDAGRG